MLTRVMAFTALLLASPAFAEYTIQVGAFGKPSQAFADRVRELGEVNTTQNARGMTVFTVGRYATSDAANADIERVRREFPDAFVRSMPDSARSPDAKANAVAAADDTQGAERAGYPRLISGTTRDSELWNSLSAEERRRVVYLDGVLHVKEGESFVPLAEYRRQSANE